MKIKAVMRQFEGGGYYRIRQPLDELARYGHETSYEPAKSDVETDGADMIVGQLIGATKVNPGVGIATTVAVHAWWRDMYRKAALVYEMDDDPFEVEPSNPAYPIYANPIVHDSIAHCIEVANLVTVSVEPLAERMSRYNKNIVVLKNRIDESLLTMQRPQRDRVTIGWAGGESHIKDIMSCSYGLKQITRYHKDVDIHFIGADLRPFVKSPNTSVTLQSFKSRQQSSPIRYTPWCKTTTDYYQLIDFDIGIAPLVPTVFAKAKSNIKCLEYAALGIPVVASDCEPYRDFVIDGVTGFLVRRDHDWAHRLRDLINDEAMRLEMGRKARELASQWTIQAGWKEWESAYAGIV